MMKMFICHNQVFCILIFFFSYVCFQVNCSSLSSSSANTIHHLCPLKQRSILLQFKSGISVGSKPKENCNENSSSKTASWIKDSDCCSWDGVTCDEVTGNVIGLDLDCSCLEGTIQDNSSLFHLSHLQWLNLAFNDFIPSQISPEFGRLTELTQLNLSNSKFDGLVPSEISHLSKLNLLDLSGFDLGGRLTINQQNFDLLVHNLTKLSVLNLEEMNMSSVKPFSLLNLSWSMMVLNLGSTGIQGKFPEEIFHLPNLQELYLDANREITGYLPKSNWSSHLAVLDLSHSNFKGEIPDSIENLKFLEILSIVGCNFAGSIPKSIGNISRVTNLELAANHFTGTLPSSISKLQKVTYISLSENMLTGEIPDIFVNFSHSPQLRYHVNVLPYLANLHLSGNLLSGRVPSWLFCLSSLYVVDLSHNKLTGAIEQFNFASWVQEVYLDNNEIQGSLPSSMFELVNLTVLDISSNNLSGTLKFDMLSKLKNLKCLDLSNNSLLSFTSSAGINSSLPNLQTFIFSFCNVSEFPSFLGTSENLESLDLSNNKIHGRIAKFESEGWNSLTDLDLSNNFLTYIQEYPWKNIVSLNFKNNMIQGSIPVPPTSVVAFFVSSNKLTGQIPTSFCDLSGLSFLDLSNNSFSGKIPSCLGNLSQLLMLHLQKNNLEGSIPDTFVNGCPLKSLDLSDNKLEGPLPRSLYHCSGLIVMNVGNNKMNDSLPCWLGTFPKLIVLALRSNRFYGPLCVSESAFTRLQVIDLSHNQFTDSLPRRFFASMGQMMNKDDQAGWDLFLPDYLNVAMKGGEHILEEVILSMFTSIDLSENWFQGEIPVILGKFKSLVVLNLSHNSLAGNIPLSLTNLTSLESLDLSFNGLNGRIPDELTNIITLEVLNLSYNHLWGHIPQGNQFNTFGNDSFIGNHGLCGEPLSVKCDNDARVAQPPPSSISQEEDEAASGFDWKTAKMGYASGVVIGMSIGYIVFSTGKPLWFVKIVEEQLMKKVRRSNQRRWRRNK